MTENLKVKVWDLHEGRSQRFTTRDSGPGAPDPSEASWWAQVDFFTSLRELEFSSYRAAINLTRAGQRNGMRRQVLHFAQMKARTTDLTLIRCDKSVAMIGFREFQSASKRAKAF